MIKKKHIFIYFTVALILSGCNSDIQSTADESASTETIINPPNIGDTDQNNSSSDDDEDNVSGDNSDSNNEDTNQNDPSSDDENNTSEDDLIHDTEDTDQNDPSSDDEDNVSGDDLIPNDVERLIKESAVESKPSNWYIRLIAEDLNIAIKVENTQLGELEESNAVQKHTLKALSPFGSTYLDIVFVDPDGVELGAYKTNFHTYQENIEDRWRFTVKTDDADAQILLAWRGLYVLTPYIDSQGRIRYRESLSLTNPLYKQMKLVDISSGQEVAAVVDEKVKTYTFNMDGQNERIFSWVLQTEEVNIPVETNKLSAPRAKVIKKDSTVVKQQIIRKKAETFDLSNPPMMK